MELEKLLNKLIEKGRDPFGNYRDIITRYKYDERFFEFNHEWDNMVSIRELVSKESWLWQFVYENNLIKTKGKKIKISTEDFDGYKGFFILYWYEYWLAMSALCNEENLEKFLLDNIKVDGE